MSKTEHLRANRGLILSRGLLAGAAGMLPVPYVDDLLAGAIRSALIRRLAEIRQVDVDANAVEALAHPYGSRVLTAVSAGAIAIGGTRRIVRKLAVTLLLMRRVDEAVQTFHIGTLFDHYCATKHLGPGLDGKRALLLRQAMEHAIHQARTEAITRAFKKGLRVMGNAAMRMPRGAFTLLSKLGGGPIRPERVETFDDRLDAAASSSFVKRAVAGVEGEVQMLERGYVAALLDTFDRTWQAHEKDQPA
jgi:uncharacterized protein (DUF697 family)